MKKIQRRNRTIDKIIQQLGLEKVNIEIIELGQLPFQINRRKLKNTKSKLFSISSIKYTPIQEYIMRQQENVCKEENQGDYVLDNDVIINNIIANNLENYNENTLYFFISYIHMAKEWYCRKVSVDNNEIQCLVFSFADIYDKLAAHNIPPENLIRSTLEAYAFCCYFDGKLPSESSEREIMHRDTRGCIMDFCVNNIDAIFSAENPYPCNECIIRLKEKFKDKSLPEVSANALAKYYDKIINSELKKIKKNWLVRVKEFIQKHIFMSLVFSFIFPFAISTISNIDCSPFNWGKHGLALISSIVLLLWIIVLICMFKFESKKFQKFRNQNRENKQNSAQSINSTPKT